MLTSLAVVFLLGFASAELFRRMGLPRILGMLLAGAAVGPYMGNLLDAQLLSVSSSLRTMALVIILVKAGLTLEISDLRRVGRPAVLLSFLPACFEIAACVLFAPGLLGVTRAEAAVIGAVLGAVSPAVVVPRMVQLIEEKRGTAKDIPQMILAGASLDDVFVIVLFSMFCAMAQGGAQDAGLTQLLSVPVSIALGLLVGAAAGMGLTVLFKKGNVRPVVRAVTVLSAAFLLMALEDALESIVPVSGLLGVMSMGMALRARAEKNVSAELAQAFGNLWTGAEALLFVLVGAAVDVRVMLDAGPMAALLIALALAVRSVGTALCTLGTKLNRKERAFTVISYWPKATVQAAIGGVPLALGLPCGMLVLSVAVLSIALTAPLGAVCMDWAAPRMLEDDSKA